MRSVQKLAAGALAGLCGLSACTGPAPAAPPVAPRDHVEEVEDADDRCPAVPFECLAGYEPSQDESGCPDPPPIVFSVPAGASTVPDEGARLLNFLTADVPHLVPEARIVVLVEAAPGEAAEETQRRRTLVASALRARGVSDSLVVFRDGPLDVAGSDPPPDRVAIRIEGCPAP